MAQFRVFASANTEETEARKNPRHYATAGPAFWRSASSKINGAFDLTNSVKKSDRQQKTLRR